MSERIYLLEEETASSPASPNLPAAAYGTYGNWIEQATELADVK